VSDINHHPLLGADDINGDIICYLTTTHHTCCYKRSLHMHVTVSMDSNLRVLLLFFRSVLGPRLFLLGWYYYGVLKTSLDISWLQVQCWGNLDNSLSLQKWNHLQVFIFGGSGVLCKSYTIQSLQLCSILYRKMCGCNHSLVQALYNACMCTFCSWLQMITSLLHFVWRLGDCIPLCTQWHGELAAVDNTGAHLPFISFNFNQGLSFSCGIF
jgi:hypothetical protein